MGKTKLSEAPTLLFTNKHCRYNDREWPKIGLILDEYLRPVYVVTDYLIYLAQKRSPRDNFGTLEEYARDLRLFWEFLSRRKIEWQEVNDYVLLKWRDMMEMGLRVSINQERVEGKPRDIVGSIDAGVINRRISTVFHFYYWCKREGRVDPDTIGCGDDGNGPYRISAQEWGKRKKWKWPFFLSTRETRRTRRPTDEEIDILHEAIDEMFGAETAHRNRLILQWKQNIGFRDIEIASLRMAMIPGAEVIDFYLENDELYPMDFSPIRQGVKTKGNRSRVEPLNVDPLLLKDTRDYIDLWRPEIVDRAKKKYGRTYKEPTEVFLSAATGTIGQPLSKKTIQNSVGAAIKVSGLEIQSRSLRVLFAMEKVESFYIGALLQAEKNLKELSGNDGSEREGFLMRAARLVDENTIIIKVQQDLGHRHSSTTLRSYLDLSKLKIFKLSNADRFAYLEKRRKIAMFSVKQLEKKLGSAAGLVAAVDNGLVEAVKNNNKDLAFEILKNALGV